MREVNFINKKIVFLILLVSLRCLMPSGLLLVPLSAQNAAQNSTQGFTQNATQNFYWENPKLITQTDSRFPVSVSSNDKAFIFWEEIDSTKKVIYLSCRRYDDFNHYSDNQRFAGPFSYSGEEVPDIFTVAVNKKGTVCAAVMAEKGQINVFCSKDECKSFVQKSIATVSSIMVAPRIYVTKNDTFKIFTSVGEENSFTLFYTDSNDGESWGRFSQFAPSKDYKNPFIPVLCATPFGDAVVFQAQYTSAETGRLSYQLYLTYAAKSQNSWSTPVLLTDRRSFSNRERKEFHTFQNQRPVLYNFENQTWMAWERTDVTNSSIWVARIDQNGLVPESAEQITSLGNANRPIFFEYQDTLCLDWFDTRRGKESVYLARKNGSYWKEEGLVEDKNANLFAYPLITSGILSFIWQQTTIADKNSIAILSPDKTVLAPTLVPLSFKKGYRSNAQDVQVQITFPYDSSNIAGYSYSWSKDSAQNPPKQLQHFTRDSKIRTKATEDGKYYLSVRVADYAGNWSEPAVIEYIMDLTPPVSPKISLSELDAYGFVSSNNFSLKWEPSASEDTTGYAYKIDYLGAIPKVLTVSKNHALKVSTPEVLELKNKLLSKYDSELERRKKQVANSRTAGLIKANGLSTARYYNRANGVYALAVYAIDEVGNMSEPDVELFILNKYQPSTYITSLSEKRNEVGELFLTIYGGGFTYDGTISEIYIDRDGKAPYDLVLKADEGKYKVQSDTRITDLNLGTELEEGAYRISLRHTDRGLYTTEKILTVSQSGTIKIESEYHREIKLNSEFKHYKYKLAANLVLSFIILLLLSISIIFMLTSVRQNLAETKLSEKEARALITGAAMPLTNLKQTLRRLPSLKKKLIRFTFSLIIIVVLAVSFENGYKVVRLQEQTMAAGLQNRCDVLLESLHSGVKNFFPANNLLELSALPSQKDAMEEVKYVTVIGQQLDSTTAQKLNFVWATNDPAINDKIDTYRLTYGESQITDEMITNITAKLAPLDLEISASCKELSDKIDELSKQAEALYKSGLEEDEAEAERLSDVAADLRTKLDIKLSEYSKNAAGSYPYFDTDNLDRNSTDYIFYRPVLYRRGTTGNYIHGVVYLELSTQTLIDSLNKEIRKIILFSVLIAIAAVVSGIVGSYLFASLIVRPIQKLEKHVNMIGQTKNKINLKGRDVEIKSKDEVGRLGDAINNMTHELVANAEEEALTMDGKAVQKAFLPLMDLGANNKNTIAEYKDNDLQCFGYYEGESGVSGDYFDYKKLDDQWFGIIKCDASGHGIPAAIIMTVVATIFRRYFENWSYAKNGTNLNRLVEQINDFIEGLGLKGKFATLIICLLNVKNGELYMCNAGDNLVHIYDAAQRKMKLITLASAPTAGVFTSDLVAMRGGFKVEKAMLNRGDTLFLYTDGIEESTRRIREVDYKVRQNQVEVRKMNPKTHQEEVEYKWEDAKEEFGPDRINEIIECVYNRKKYVLNKLENPNQTESLEFDFSKCEGTVSEAIMALAASEKVYRLYKSPSVQRTDYIKIDKKIDEFLSRYFNMYGYYAANKSQVSDGSNYVDYDQMQEDEQSDDLTMLAIKRL